MGKDDKTGDICFWVRRGLIEDAVVKADPLARGGSDSVATSYIEGFSSLR